MSIEKVVVEENKVVETEIKKIQMRLYYLQGKK